MIVDDVNRETARRLAEQFQFEIGSALSLNDVLSEGLRADVLYRVKSEISSKEKLQRRQIPGQVGKLNDFLGLRVLLTHWDQLDEALSFIRKWASERGLSELKFGDWSKDRHLRPYRSVHIDFDLPEVVATGANVMLGMEIQITTHISRLIADISHDLVYKHGKLPYRDEEQQRLLSLISSQSAALEDTIAQLFRLERGGRLR